MVLHVDPRVRVRRHAGPAPCSAPTSTEECAPSCLDLYEEVYDTQPSCSGERLREVTAGYRASTLYDQWADGITVPYLDTITEDGDAHVYREPVGGGTPVKIATGTGRSQVQRFYLATELPQMESSGVGTPFVPDTVSTGGGSLAACLLATGSTQNWAVLVRYVKRPVWTALPWAIRVVAGAAGRTIEIDGTTLTLTISGTPVTYDLTGKTVEDVIDLLDTHPSALLTSTLSEAAIGDHPATDLLAETDAKVVPTSGYLLLALAGYTLLQSVAGDAYAPRWQVGQFDSPEAPDDMPIGVRYSAVDFAGTELQFYAGIAADWTASPKPAMTPFGAGNDFFFPTLTEPALVPVEDASVDEECTTGDGSAYSSWKPALDGCTGYACFTASDSGLVSGTHQAWSISRD